jgi:hypothetical protein
MPVNFIADPWEWGSLGRIEMGDRCWTTAYQEFKARLHWLLLWNDEIQVVDSFVLFNRQFEQWFDQAKARSTGRKALEGVFRERAIRVALRSDRASEFSTLTEIDAIQVRGNPEFRWFYGGSPSQNFIRELDAYLNLPDLRYAARYQGWRRPNRMRDCFAASLERVTGLEAIYREFRLLREALPARVAKDLLSVPGDDWRRSKLYTRLGYGLDEKGRTVRKGADLAKLPDELRRQMRRLVDWSFYFGVHDALRPLPSRFPGDNPPAAFYELFPPSRKGLTHDQEKEEGSWLQETLRDVDVGSVRLEGDMDALFGRLREFDLEDFWALRQRSSFKDYRQLYADLEAKGPDGFKDLTLCSSVVSAKFRCLAELGSMGGVQITQGGAGAITLGFLAHPVGTSLVAWGLVLLARAKGVPIVAGVLARPIAWLSTRLQHVGTRDRPLRAKVRYVGPIRTSD